MEIIASGCNFNISLITGMTRFNSSSSPTGSEPGLVDSPPISIISTPDPIISIACPKDLFLSK